MAHRVGRVDRSTREEAGNKARGVALRRGRGLPVPPPFVLPTHVGRLFIGVRADHIAALLQPVIDPPQRDTATVLATGEPACPGLASGLAVGDADEAEQVSGEGRPVVLVRRATSPQDVHGMIASAGVVTEIGGRTSHAAVVSRELGRPAVVGCGEGTLQRLLGKLITIDGATGEVFEGELATRHPELSDHPQPAQLAAWAQELRDDIPDHPLLGLAATAVTEGAR